ncbi:MAG: hypothetical protein ACOCWQ_05220, partial [Nanoarchaeota archaeon]
MAENQQHMYRLDVSLIDGGRIDGPQIGRTLMSLRRIPGIQTATIEGNSIYVGGSVTEKQLTTFANKQARLNRSPKNIAI